MPWFPLAIAALLIFYIAFGVLRAVVLQSRRPLDPATGCVCCGAGGSDVVLSDQDGAETYCWSCIDAWRSDTGVPEHMTITPFPGHERSAA